MTRCIVKHKQSTNILPSGYTQLEYIEAASAGPYIQLNYGFDNTDEVTLDSQPAVTAEDKFLVSPQRWNTNTNRFSLSGNCSGCRGVGYGGLTTGNTKYTNIIPNTTHATETYSNYIFTYDDGSNTDSYDATSVTWGGETTNLKLFYGYNSVTAGKIYSWKHKKVVSGVLTLVENLVPAQRDSDSVLGMYDTVSNTFFTNAGTGTFTGGEETNKIVQSLIVTKTGETPVVITPHAIKTQEVNN